MNKPKLKKLKKLSTADAAKRQIRRIPRPNLKKRPSTEERVAEALSNVPRITTETLAEHREDVLKSARKYIYPLQHSKHRIVRISLVLLVAAIVLFFGYCTTALYKFQSTSGFMYGVTRVIPFPVAKAGPRWISYESYLFELRRNMHYYRTQQKATFAGKDGKVQLARIKQQSLSQVTRDAYVKILADQHHVSVSDRQVSAELDLVRSQNRLGGNDRVFKDVLTQYWGWSEADFRRELQQQLLQQAVVTKLDTAAAGRASSVLKQLQAGADFATLAGQNSDDVSTRGNGGQYGTVITVTDRDIAPQITAALFNLKVGQTSSIINAGYTLEILKLNDRAGNTAHASHIQFNLQPITTYTKPLSTKDKAHNYLNI